MSEIEAAICVVAGGLIGGVCCWFLIKLRDWSMKGE